MWLIPSALLVLAGCVGDLASLVTLQKELLGQYPGTEVTVTINQREHLVITLRNGAVNDAAPEQQAEVARQVATYAYEHYPSATQLEDITVRFGTARRTGGLAITNDSGAYLFTAEDLAHGPEPQGEDMAEAVPSAS